MIGSFTRQLARMVHSKKELLLKVLHGTGLLRFFAASQRNKVTILMLHGVTDPSTPSFWTPLRSQLSVRQLELGLETLSQYYHFVSLSDAVEMLAGIRPLVPNSLAFTFDDGYRNSITNALPVLHRFKAPATIFLSTGNITEREPFWFDRLDFAVQTMNDETLSRAGLPELNEIDFSTRETLSRSFITFIRKETRRYPSVTMMRAAITNLTERLEQRSGRGLAGIFSDDPWSGILTWSEVRKAVSEVHFASHTVNHAQLALLPPDVARQELIQSREAIEFHTGSPCTCLAYPYGSYNDGVISLARSCGYSSAVTSIGGLNHYGDELLALRRIAFPRNRSSAGVLVEASGLLSYRLKLNKKIFGNEQPQS